MVMMKVLKATSVNLQHLKIITSVSLKTTTLEIIYKKGDRVMRQ